MILKGLNKGSRPTNIDEGQWVDGRNFIITADGKSIKNEDGTSISSTHTFTIIGIISLPNGYVVFSYGSSGGTNYFKIETVIDGVQTTRLRTQYLTYNLLNQIEGAFKYNYDGSLLLYWWDGVNTTSHRPCVMNVDSPIFSLNSGQELVTPANIGLIYLFPDCAVPNLTIANLNNNGGTIDTGSYYFIISYMLDNYNNTKYLIPSNPLPLVVQNSNTTNGTTQTGNVNKSVTFNLTGLDTRYSKFRVACLEVRTNAKTIAASNIIGEYNINQSAGTGTFTFTGDYEGSIDSASLLIDPLSFTLIKSGTVLNSDLIFGNITMGYNIDYQKYANNISVQWIKGTQTNFSDSDVNLMFGKSLMPDEVYALNIHLVMKDGTLSPGFHIPGRAAIANYPFLQTNNTPVSGGIVENAALNTIGGLTTSENTIANAKVFHTRDTSTSGGNMGYWENNDDYYPSTSEYDIWNVDDGTHGHSAGTGYATGNTLQGSKVRHHKIPSIATLYPIGIYPDMNPDLNCPIGITLTNIKFPSSILSQIQGYVISYCARDFNNATIVGTDILKHHAWWFEEETIMSGNQERPPAYDPYSIALLRFNDIALMNGQKEVNADYIKPSYQMGVIVPTTYDFYMPIALQATTFVTGNLYGTKNYINCYPLAAGQSPYYISSDNSATTPDNTGEEACLIVPLRTSDLSMFVTGYSVWDFNDTPFTYSSDFWEVPTPPSSPPTNCTQFLNKWWVGNLCKIVLNAYRLLDDNPLSLISNIHYTNTAYSYNSPAIYGFDSFISIYRYYCRAENQLNNNYIASPPYRELNYNPIPFILKYYSPYNAQFRANDSSPVITTPGNEGNPLDFNIYDYNEAFSAVNTIKTPSKYDYLTTYLTVFPYRLQKSLTSASESTIDYWRTFMPNDYHESIKDKGCIWGISSVNKTLVIRYQYQWYIASIRETLQTETNQAFLGTGDIFTDAAGNQTLLEELTPSKDGYFGCNSQFAAFNFLLGYFGIDNIKGKAMILEGKPIEITNNESKNYFESIFQFDNLNSQYDNPLNQVGITAAYDEQNDRILISVHTRVIASAYTYYGGGTILFYDSNGISIIVPYQYYNTVVLCGGNLYGFDDAGSGALLTNGIFDTTYYTDNYLTISYNTKFSIWAFLHDTPSEINYLFSSKGGIYYVSNSDKTIRQLNTSSVKCTSASYIDLVFNNPKDITKVLNNINWRTDVIESNGVKIYNKTLTGIMVYNDTQCSGIIPINTANTWYNKSSGRDLSGEWFFNNVLDYVIDETQPILDSNNQPIANNVNKSAKNWYDNSLFKSNYIVVRLIYDNNIENSTNDIYITGAKVNFSNSDR
jgi:hypothetical protein